MSILILTINLLGEVGSKNRGRKLTRSRFGGREENRSGRVVGLPSAWTDHTRAEHK
jgi:hypothetical protein